MRKIFLILFSLFPILSHAEEAQNSVPKIDSGDTSWLLISTALVMLMTPALGLFYGGMVRKKNVLATIVQSLITIGIVTVLWIIYGYSLAFGPDLNHIIGDLSWFGLKGVSFEPNPDYGATVPHVLFMIYQLMFAIITPALITGAFAERFKFKTYLVFIVLWHTFVYLPLAHWVWGVGGWIRNLGALDFAGGLVVHISSGASALIAAIICGKRKGFLTEPMPPHNLTMTIIGGAILWFGWFGFNGGSAIGSNSLAVNAFITTHIAASSASLSWMIVEWLHNKKPTGLGIISGVVAGLVAITPAAGFVTPISALFIGLVAGVLCFFAVLMKTKLGYDDSLDAVGVHGIGGTWGAIATGLFATKSVNPAGADGLLYGNASLLFTQILTVIVGWIYPIVVTYIILKILDKLMGLRVSKDEEIEGLDLSQHGESGYTF
ncbi:MAG: ammonium transporter [Proteobacteria bacterium]|nr:ammonium transporter [Pseudomonadota bacterium]